MTTLLSSDPRLKANEVADCYDVLMRKELLELARDQIEELDAKRDQIRRSVTEAEAEVEICFLGKAGVGKSTLINALVAGVRQVLPSGGIGTLTAQATRLVYSSQPRFEARYRGADFIHQIVFGLEKKLEAQLKKQESSDSEVVDLSFLDNLPEDADELVDRADDLERQARLLVTGRQDAAVPLPYLIDALLIAQRKAPKHATKIDPMDGARVSNITQRLEFAKEKRAYCPSGSTDDAKHLEDLLNHAAGHLAPMVTELTVGWPSESIKPGMTMVDLPGLGIAKDIYRKVTEHHIRNVAKAVVLVVDRSGIDEDSAELLQLSGFFNRMISTCNDLSKDPVLLVIVAVGMDKTAGSNYMDAQNTGTGKGRKPSDFLLETRTLMVEKLRRDLDQHLNAIASRLSREGGQAGREVVEHLVKNSLICAVSTVEYTWLLQNDPAYPAHIENVGQSGIPDLSQRLTEAVDHYRDRLMARAAMNASEMKQRLSVILAGLKTTQEAGGKVDNQVKELQTAFDTFIKDIVRDLDARRGSFREFLTNGLQERISRIVEQAGKTAMVDAQKSTADYAKAHWKTLVAAVSGGGRHSGAMDINLPASLSNPYEAQIMALLVKEVIPDIQKRASELADDYQKTMEKIVRWAEKQPGAKSRIELVRHNARQFSENAKAMSEVGLLGAEEIRKNISKQLYNIIRDPISNECKKFIREGRDAGAGVKKRIVKLFIEELIPLAIQQSSSPAKKLLSETTEVVTTEIRNRFRRYPEPLEAARLALFGDGQTDPSIEAKKAAIARIEQLQTQLGNLRGSTQAA